MLDVMTTPQDIFDGRRVLFRDPAGDEERALDAVVVQQVQQQRYADLRLVAPHRQCDGIVRAAMHPHDIRVEVEREQAGALLALWPWSDDGLEFKNLRSFAALRFGECSRSAHVVPPA